MCYDWDYAEETEIIRFDGYSPRGTYGISPDNLIVFVDKFRDPGVKHGETWICRLCRNRSTESKNYWAWPIEKMNNVQEEKEVAAEIPVSVSSEGVIAVGNDTLCSDMFRSCRYSAFRSLNGNYLQLIEDEAGNLECKGGRISIENLDTFIGCACPVSLHYSVKSDGLLIKLEQ